MVEFIPHPDPHILLPPLLACLPAAFASPRPPPALLTLLSPILKQRLQLLTSTSTSDNWLRSLCWDSKKADQLKDVVENGTYEPHLASGEIEVGEIELQKYKRFDQETLRTQISLPHWDMTVSYLWCLGGDEGNGWRLAELLPYDNDMEHDSSWSNTIGEANESATGRILSEAVQAAEAAEKGPSIVDNDDDYWAQYDKMPLSTPTIERSPAPDAVSQTDADYYAQYGQVQPAMDNHEPLEEAEHIGESSLNGDALQGMLRKHYGDHDKRELEITTQNLENQECSKISQPMPSSPSSANAEAISKLEQSASLQSASEMGIRQHISTSMKSLFRLAKSAGMDREEFDRLIQRELGTLSILERED